MTDNRIYTSPSMKIGKCLWRAYVYNHERFGRCSDYEFQQSGSLVWQKRTSYPSYNEHDGTYEGLPKRLVQLYETHIDQIKHALTGETPRQGALL